MGLGPAVTAGPFNCHIELSSDLSKTVSEWPVTMFRATENPSVKEMNGLGEATFGRKLPGWVTDGPQMFRTQTDKLVLLDQIVLKK